MKQEKLVTFVFVAAIVILAGAFYFFNGVGAPEPLPEQKYAQRPDIIPQNTPQNAPDTLKNSSGTGYLPPQSTASCEVCPGEYVVFEEPPDGRAKKSSNFVIPESLTSLTDYLAEKAQKAFQDSLKKPVTKLPTIPPPATVGNISKKFTEAELFLRVWPKEHRDLVLFMQNLVIVNGTTVSGWSNIVTKNADGDDSVEPLVDWQIPQSEKVESATSDEDMYQMYLQILEQAYKNKLISDTEYVNFKRGITELLPQLVEHEKNLLRSGATQSLMLPGNQRTVKDVGAQASIMALLEGLRYVFFLAEPANAAWVTRGDCYKDDAPDPAAPKGGYNGWAFCCNCGLVHRSNCPMRFRQDCGTNGSSCDVQLGCLNMMCGFMPNAIWDPMGGLCGCG